MTKELKKAIETVKAYLDMDSDINSEYLNAQRTIIQALEQQPKPMEKFDDVKTHIQRLAGDYKCWDNRLTWEEALELNRMLEAQPCEDCVSRSELQKTMDSLPLFRFVNNDHEEADDYYNCESVDMVIRNLPSVTPQTVTEFADKCKECGKMLNDKLRMNLAETSQDCISRQQALDCFEQTNTRQGAKYAIETLPSVTPQRPKGKWIEVEVHNCHATLKCSVCDRVIEPTFTFGEYSYEDIKTFYPYCHCGAEMSGGGEDEDNN